MEAALTLLLAIVAVSLLGIWIYALWRGWSHASRYTPRPERRLAASALAALVLLPVALAVLGASDDTATIAIAIGMAAVLPVLIYVAVRDHRRRETYPCAPSRHRRWQ